MEIWMEELKCVFLEKSELQFLKFSIFSHFLAFGVSSM